jgi:2Fe-2S ferredoxin
MARITIKNMESKTIDWNDKKERLLNILLSSSDWMHACGGKGRCTTCKVKILTGQENLSDMTQAEIKYFKAGMLEQNERLSCQVNVSGDLYLCVPSVCQLPHLKYSACL